MNDNVCHRAHREHREDRDGNGSGPRADNDQSRAKATKRAVTEDKENTEMEMNGQRFGDLSRENQISEGIIGCAIEVHRVLGPGLLESVYESALCVELTRAGWGYERQKPIPITYKGELIGEFRVDMVVEDLVIVEVKAVERFDPVFEAQLLSYLRATSKRVGLLINFNSRLLKSGIKRLVL